MALACLSAVGGGHWLACQKPRRELARTRLSVIPNPPGRAGRLDNCTVWNGRVNWCCRGLAPPSACPFVGACVMWQTGSTIECDLASDRMTKKRIERTKLVAREGADL